MKSAIPWSWSSYSAYQTCPRQFYELKVARTYVEPESQPLIWGNEVHKAIELYGTQSVPVPATMQRFVPIVDKVASAPGDTYYEMELACTIDMRPTGFWDEDAWCRGKGDVIKVNGTKALAGDWKTGKWKPESLQLDLMGLMVFAKFPSVYDLTTVFIYFQEPTKPVSKKFTRDDMPSMLSQFADGVRDMEYSFATNVWPEKPSGLCKRHCPVATCKYYQRGARRW